MIHASHKEFETLNLLPMIERFNQCINLIVFKYVNDQWPNYLYEVSQTVPEFRVNYLGPFFKKSALFYTQEKQLIDLDYFIQPNL